jgi:predicted nucleic acid-binding protein
VSTFVDTSALLAVLDADQSRHAEAAAAWRALLEGDAPLVVTNYVLVETYALAERRLGVEAVRVLTHDFVPLLVVEWIDEATHTAAVAALLTAGRRGLSLVDCASFLAMRRRGVTRAFAFDADFVEQGFDVVPREGESARD